MSKTHSQSLSMYLMKCICSLVLTKFNFCWMSSTDFIQNVVRYNGTLLTRYFFLIICAVNYSYQFTNPVKFFLIIWNLFLNLSTWVYEIFRESVIFYSDQVVHDVLIYSKKLLLARRNRKIGMVLTKKCLTIIMEKIFFVFYRFSTISIHRK